MSFPHSTPEQLAAAITGIKLSHLVHQTELDTAILTREAYTGRRPGTPAPKVQQLAEQ
jgi:hypothetical protein